MAPGDGRPGSPAAVLTPGDVGVADSIEENLLELAAFIREADETLREIDDTAEHLGVSTEDARLLCDNFDVCYAINAEAMLEGGEDKIRRVVDDFRRIGQGGQRRMLAAILLSRFAYYLRGTTKAEVKSEDKIRNLWNQPASFKGMVELAMAVATDGLALALGFISEVRERGNAVKLACWVQGRGRAGFTNAAVLCLRGPVDDVDNGGCIPLARPGMMQKGDSTSIVLPFPPVDNVLDRAAVAESRASASSASAAAKDAEATASSLPTNAALSASAKRARRCASEAAGAAAEAADALAAAAGQDGGGGSTRSNGAAFGGNIYEAASRAESLARDAALESREAMSILQASSGKPTICAPDTDRAPGQSTRGRTPSTLLAEHALAKDDSPIRLGSALHTKNTRRVIFGKSVHGLGSPGVRGEQQRGVCGAEENASSKSTGPALFARALPGVRNEHPEQHSGSHKLSPEARAETECLEDLRVTAERLLAAVDKADGSLDECSRRDLDAVMQDLRERCLPRAMKELRLGSVEVLEPLRVCFTIKKKADRGWVVVFPCPMRCEVYLRRGLCSESVLKTDHIAKGTCPLNGDKAKRYVCVHGPSCKPGRGEFFSHQSLAKHLRDHGLEEVCTGGASKTPGCLAPLSLEMMEQMGDPWFCEENGALPGSAYYDSMAKLSFTYSKHFKYGQDGVPVLDPGFCVGPPTHATGEQSEPADEAGDEHSRKETDNLKKQGMCPQEEEPGDSGAPSRLPQQSQLVDKRGLGKNKVAPETPSNQIVGQEKQQMRYMTDRKDGHVPGDAIGEPQVPANARSHSQGEGEVQTVRGQKSHDKIRGRKAERGAAAGLESASRGLSVSSPNARVGNVCPGVDKGKGVVASLSTCDKAPETVEAAREDALRTSAASKRKDGHIGKSGHTPSKKKVAQG
ncbi:unnamed protein product [Scytosiphon promiscuus]